MQPQPTTIDSIDLEQVRGGFGAILGSLLQAAPGIMQGVSGIISASKAGKGGGAAPGGESAAAAQAAAAPAGPAPAALPSADPGASGGCSCSVNVSINGVAQR